MTETSKVFFTVGAILAAVAKNFNMILIGKSIQGIGGGGATLCLISMLMAGGTDWVAPGLVVLTEIVITDVIPLRKRPMYFSFIQATYAFGTVTGPVIGGSFVGASWRWIFWINLPFCAIAFVLIPIFLTLKKRPDAIWDKLGHINWVGMFIFIGSLTSTLIPLSWGGVMFQWDNWRTRVPLLIGCAGLGHFLTSEKLGAAKAMINLRLFTNRTAAANYFGITVQSCILYVRSLLAPPAQKLIV
jgi:MFS family permease